jgi:hypothetical protein
MTHPAVESQDRLLNECDVPRAIGTYRIGQIVPSSNTTMETEIPALLRARWWTASR